MGRAPIIFHQDIAFGIQNFHKLRFWDEKTGGSPGRRKKESREVIVWYKYGGRKG